MTIDEAKSMRQKLCFDIQALIEEFENSTGARVDGLFLDRVGMLGCSAGVPRIVVDVVL